ncbi:hypothetical protein LTR96_010765 [Exophiala xenobiotica]|uniref:Heterokaryon incompatibility domain-containing protein n=1 Tax=Vermiconidia calcicola TaxID=1690605 RepID=A0AAV9PR44_9PEZI|nr:hypothetical protein LTR96_010765 [Exophiala xenobiotica]KAK5333137.1 hypothetical protein LTR98_010778 [Exophiala xenobiotica]KAK5425701.1 hypothetical protein LTR34_010881 [Exophiala xenobiotica]KAK5527977.1 hypothetical protein LTR25_010776 [Vermiconidia calcicola]
MRLLEFDGQGELRLTKNLDENIPPYAILSHTWGADDEEVTFKDLESGSSEVKVKLGYRKLLFCGERAKRDGLQYFWVDTCCIDKANHTELSEAITSMFRWYRDSVVCYVSLSDVSVGICDKIDEIKETWDSAFRSSRWFTRGWTLQELIAPRSVEFFSLEGELLGNKEVLEQQIQEVTGLPIAALRGASLSDFSVDERLRWAENRQTRKEEDKAYCLLGIFNVFMPLIYGEGENAFIRLKEVIERSSRTKLDEATNKSLDESRLAVLGGLDGQVPGLIARLATEFVKEVQNHTPNLAVQMQEAFRTQEKELTNQGLDSLQHITRTVDVAKITDWGPSKKQG